MNTNTSNNIFKRWLIAILCVAMVAGSIPVPTEAMVLDNDLGEETLDLLDDSALDSATSEKTEDISLVSDIDDNIDDNSKLVAIEREYAVTVYDSKGDKKESYYTLKDAIADVTANSTIKLLKDVCEEEVLVISKNLVIDLNDNILDAGIKAGGPTPVLEVMDSSTEKTVRYLSSNEAGKYNITYNSSGVEDEISVSGGIWTNSHMNPVYSAYINGGSTEDNPMLDLHDVTVAGWYYSGDSQEGAIAPICMNYGRLNVYDTYFCANGKSDKAKKTVEDTDNWMFAISCCGVEYAVISGNTIFDSKGVASCNSVVRSGKIIISDSVQFLDANTFLCALYVEEELHIGDDVLFKNCRSAQNGGAICFNSEKPACDSFISISGNVKFDSCYSVNGGAISTKKIYKPQKHMCYLDIYDSVAFINCSAKKIGGAITLENCTIANISGNVTFTDCSANAGGALDAFQRSKYIISGNVNFEGCNANLETTNPEFVGKIGGAIFIEDTSECELYGKVSMNSCFADKGGAICCGAGGALIIYDGVVITDCNAAEGGAIYCENGSEVSILSDLIIKDCCADKGGAIYCEDGSLILILDKMLIESCEANEGGAIFFENADVNSIVSGNLVIMSCNGIFGGAINVQDGKLYLDGECIISDNKANGSDNNICLSNNAVLVISPDFNGIVGISLDDYSNYPRIITSGGDSTGAIVNNGNIYMDNPSFSIRLRRGNLVAAPDEKTVVKIYDKNNKCIGEYPDVFTAIKDVEDGDIIRLVDDVKLDSPLVLSSNVTIDLNDHILDAGFIAGEGSPTLTVVDNSETHTTRYLKKDENGKYVFTDSPEGAVAVNGGVWTNSHNDYPYYSDNEEATLNLNGINVAGCSAPITVSEGQVNIYDTDFAGNAAKDKNGNSCIYYEGSDYLIISGNTVFRDCGNQESGSAVAASKVKILDDVLFENCISCTNGAALSANDVYMYDRVNMSNNQGNSGALYLSDNSILHILDNANVKDNSSEGNDGNVLLGGNDSYIDVSANYSGKTGISLEDYSSLPRRISTYIEGDIESLINNGNIFLDDSQYMLVIKEDANGKFLAVEGMPIVSVVSSNGTVKGSFSELKSAINKAASTDSVRLLADISANTIELNKTVTIDLNDYVLDTGFVIKNNAERVDFTIIGTSSGNSIHYLNKQGDRYVLSDIPGNSIDDTYVSGGLWINSKDGMLYSSDRMKSCCNIKYVNIAGCLTDASQAPITVSAGRVNITDAYFTGNVNNSSGESCIKAGNNSIVSISGNTVFNNCKSLSGATIYLDNSKAYFGDTVSFNNNTVAGLPNDVSISNGAKVDFDSDFEGHVGITYTGNDITSNNKIKYTVTDRKDTIYRTLLENGNVYIYQNHAADSVPLELKFSTKKYDDKLDSNMLYFTFHEHDFAIAYGGGSDTLYAYCRSESCDLHNGTNAYPLITLDCQDDKYSADDASYLYKKINVTYLNEKLLSDNSIVDSVMDKFTLDGLSISENGLTVKDSRGEYKDYRSISENGSYNVELVVNYDGNAFVLKDSFTVNKTVSVTFKVLSENATFAAGTLKDDYYVYTVDEHIAGTLVAAPDKPIARIQGAKFVGWFNNDTKWNFSSPVNESITLVARFKNCGEVMEEDYGQYSAISIEGDFSDGQDFWVGGVKDVIYTGSKITFPNLHVYDGDILLKKGVDYTVSYKNNINAADKDSAKAPTVVVQGKGNFNKTVKIKFTIHSVNIDNTIHEALYDEPNNIEYDECVIKNYNGKVQKAVPAFTWAGKKLTLDKNQFLVEYYDSEGINPAIPKESGQYTIRVSGKGKNFEGSVDFEYNIVDTVSLKKAKLAGLKKSYPFNEEGVIPAGLSVTIGKVTLEPGVDYTLEYSNNYSVGKAYCTVVGLGNYEGSTKVFSYNIVGASIKKLTFTGINLKSEYTGDEITFDDARFFLGDKELLVSEGDVFVKYKNNVNVGKASIVVTGNPSNGYSGSRTINFKIKGYDLNADSLGLLDVEVDGAAYYNKLGAKVTPYITFDDYTLKVNADYTLKYLDNKKLGEATVLVKGKGNFAGTLIISYDVLAADFADSITEYDDYLTVDTPLLSVVAPDVKVNTKKKNSFKSPVMVNELVSGKKLKAGKDYSLTYTKDNEPVPEGMTAAQEGAVYTVKITGMAPFYTGSVELEYQVVGNSLPKVKGIAALNILYLGDEIILRPKTSADDTDYNFYLQSGSGSKIKSYFALEKGVNDDTAQYRIISYRNNIKKGTATIVIRGINGYAGAKSVTFKIKAQPIDQTLYK